MDFNYIFYSLCLYTYQTWCNTKRIFPKLENLALSQKGFWWQNFCRNSLFMIPFVVMCFNWWSVCSSNTKKANKFSQHSRQLTENIPNCTYYPQSGISNPRLGILYPLGYCGFLSEVKQSQKSNPQSPIG